jgi:hypothetical protein
MFACGNDDTLGTGEAELLADLEETFHLLGDAAHGLDLSHLVDGSRDRQVLPEGDACDGGDQSVDLGGGGAVSVDPHVGLLHGHRGADR